MEANWNPMGGGTDVDMLFSLPSTHEAFFSEREAKRKEQEQLNKLEAETVLLGELNGAGGVIAQRLINSAVDQIRTALYSPASDAEIVHYVKLARGKLDAIQEALHLSAMLETSTKYMVLEFVLEHLGMRLPHLTTGYRAPFSQAAPGGTPAEG